VKILWDNFIYMGLGANFFLIPLILSFDAADLDKGETTIFEKTWLF